MVETGRIGAGLDDPKSGLNRDNRHWMRDNKEDSSRANVPKTSVGNRNHILFYKPYGVLTQFTGEPGERTLKEFINIPYVYPVGRLDKDSEGLVLLTDDGVVQYRLSHPKFDKDKTYWVQVEGAVTEQALDQLRRGIAIQDYVTKTAKAKLIDEPNVPPRDPPIRFRKDIPTSWIEITITEGKNRQVRRMTAAVGFPTLRLIRIAIGQLRLDGLAPGEWRMLTPSEMSRL